VQLFHESLANQCGGCSFRRLVSLAQRKQAAQAALPEPSVKVGEVAPDFTLKDSEWEAGFLKDFRGKQNVAVAFYVSRFRPAEAPKRRASSRILQKLEASTPRVLGVTDGWFFREIKPDGSTGHQLPDVKRHWWRYPALWHLQPADQAARRATFLIDKSGKVLEIQLDKEALDPANAVAACERHKLKG